jgi:hypothetical protein
MANAGKTVVAQFTKHSPRFLQVKNKRLRAKKVDSTIGK